MASKLRVLDADGCRAVGRRALRTISFREEDAKLNIWVALINLEYREASKKGAGGSGGMGGVEAVVREACAAAHPKRIRLRVAAMYEESGDAAAAEAAYAAAAKKHKTSKQVWSAYVRFRLLGRGDVEAASEALDRALACLAQHKHLYVISRYAQDEFAGGSVERGRSPDPMPRKASRSMSETLRLPRCGASSIWSKPSMTLWIREWAACRRPRSTPKAASPNNNASPTVTKPWPASPPCRPDTKSPAMRPSDKHQPMSWGHSNSLNKKSIPCSGCRAHSCTKTTPEPKWTKPPCNASCSWPCTNGKTH